MTSKTKNYTSQEKDTLKMADNLFSKSAYEPALSYYKGLYAVHPEDLSLTYKMGVCYLYKSDEHSKAIDCFTQVLEKDKKASDITYYLGKAYFMDQQYDQALEYFNQYLSVKKADGAKKKEIGRLIENCNNGKILMGEPLEVKIRNIGPTVNTEASEYGPVISSDESVLIYTYKGSRSTGGKQNKYNQPDPNGMYFEDVFISERVNGAWSEPQSIGSNINGDGHDACIALSSDGQKLFIYKNTSEDFGDIYMSRLQGKEWSEPERLEGTLNTPDAWEGSITLSADERTVYFSSERKGGLGGRDLYKATLQRDGSWGDVSNLGPKINTKDDDDAPFIHPDGTQLYFSSQGHNSIGGYDIFRVELLSDGSWSEPVNLGYPINTADDDRFYVLTADGKKGYYSSGKAGGYGNQDIYVVEPGTMGKKAVLTLIKGKITLNNQPVKASIIVSNADDRTEKSTSTGEYISNAASGKYLINLPAGVNYKITYSLEGFDDQYQLVDAKNISSFEEKNIDIDFHKKEDAPLPQPEPVKPREDTITAIIPQTYEEYLSQYGNTSLPELEFWVQIAAFRMPENYNYKKLEGLGKIEKKDNGGDDVTRFIIGGSFKTLAAADAHKNKVVARGTSDAFVFSTYQGKRISLKELAAKNFLQNK